MLQDLRRKSPFAHLQGPPGLLPEPERFVEWVAAGQVGRAPAPGELVVLTADGSFDPDTGKAGWGMVVSLVSAHDLLLPGQFAGCISGSTRELQQVLGDAFPCNNAYLAEVSGLFWAGALAFRLPHAGSWVFRADNIGALQGVAGTVQMQDHALCRAAAAVHTAFGLLHHSATYQHVPGHSADPANELADALAKSASRRHTTFSLPGFTLETWFAKGGIAFEWLPHMCLSDVFPDTLPKLHNDVLEWSRGAAPFSVPAADTMRPFLRAVSGVEVKRQGARQETSLVCASFNALSLLDTQPDSHAAGLHGATGRVKLLCESLESFGVHLGGIQECRTLPGTMLCRGFHRFASGRDENACYGVELWVAANGPFDPRAVTVLHKEPTFLLAGLPFLGGTLRVLVAHGPHRVHSESFRAQWWQHVTQVCAAHCRDASWIVLADANCRVGEHVSSSIGPHQADPEDFSGSFFRAFLDRFECWLPSTFANTAYGLGGTLYQRRNGEWDRSDFVAVPSTWLFSSCLAWVECSISAGHQCLDHLAVLVQCSVVDRPPARCSTRARRIDPGALADPANRMAVEGVISSAPRFPWDADASVQAAAVVDHVYRGLAALFPQQRRPMRGDYFSEETHRLHRLVASLRHSIRAKGHAFRCALLRCVLVAWRPAGPSFPDIFRGAWLWQLRIHHGLDCMLLRRFGRALRRSCRSDRRDHLAYLSAQVADSPCAELHTAVRRIMRPKKYRKPGASPLPLLHKPTGGVCVSQEEITQVWRNHFRTLEAGREVSAASLAETCRSRQQCFEGTDQVDSALVPTWAQLHAAFKATAPHKACGPDLLPPILCKLFSQRLTEAFWPIMLKAVFRSNEAVGLKGGLLHRIAKPNAVANTTAGYRGILVQSCLSKVLHRAARHMAVSHWDKHVLPLQIGGRKGCPASFGHFCSRAFLAMTRAKGQSAAVLFVDIAAAYYGVIREAVLGTCAEGRPLCELVDKLGLAPEDLQYLQHVVDQEPALRQQNAEELFVEVANELHRSTWFVLAGDSCVIETHRGTRPGGSLADVVFSILFSKVLQRRPLTACHPFVPQVAWDGLRSPWPSANGRASAEVEASDVVYADDLASFVVCDSPQALPGAISGIVADTIDTLLPHGLNANVGPTKTAAIAVPAGRGSRAVRRRLFSEGKGRLVVLPETRGGLRLDLVTVYKHLGSLVTHDGCLLQEIKYRISAGRSAMQEGKQRLFACKAIPLERRVAIFRSHVLSAVTPGVGTWRFLNGREWQAFSGGVLNLYRQILCLRTEGGFRCTATQIFSRTGLPSPTSLLQVERLRFLGQLVRHGPDAAWALLGHYADYQEALREASRWLLDAVGTTCQLRDIESDWASWEAYMRDSPGKWKSLLKRADCWYAAKDNVLASLDGFARGAWEVDETNHSFPVADCVHACLHCRIAFRTRQQWGAHAHRVHGYHSRAHMVAQGRSCRACGLQLATEAKLRTHLRLSLPCVQKLERIVAAGPCEPDLTPAHILAPAVPGVGKAALGPAAPETLSSLALALAAFSPPASDVDEAILSLVMQFTAPLPVLRCTLEAWMDSLPVGFVRQACEDVLLILHPEHLCDRVAGLANPAAGQVMSFIPRISPPASAGIRADLPVWVTGGSPPAWFLAWFGDQACPVAVEKQTILRWTSTPIAGACVTFSSPPREALPAFAPPPCPLRTLQALRAWVAELLDTLLVLFAIARAGRHVLVRLPADSSSLHPLTAWLTAMSGEAGAVSTAHPCFTFEFISV